MSEGSVSLEISYKKSVFTRNRMEISDIAHHSAQYRIVVHWKYCEEEISVIHFGHESCFIYFILIIQRKYLSYL